MQKNEIHDNHEAHKIASELRHHDFAAARHELSKEAHHPHEFRKLVEKLNHDLKAEHQHPLTLEHDKHGNITHLHFGAHDIYDKAHHSGHHKDAHHPHKAKDVPHPPNKPADEPSKAADTPPKAADTPAAIAAAKPESAEVSANKNNELLKKLDTKLRGPAQEILELSANAERPSKEMDRLRTNIENLSRNQQLTTEEKVHTLKMELAAQKRTPR